MISQSVYNLFHPLVLSCLYEPQYSSFLQKSWIIVFSLVLAIRIDWLGLLQGGSRRLTLTTSTPGFKVTISYALFCIGLICRQICLLVLYRVGQAQQVNSILSTSPPDQAICREAKPERKARSFAMSSAGANGPVHILHPLALPLKGTTSKARVK